MGDAHPARWARSPRGGSSRPGRHVVPAAAGRARRPGGRGADRAHAGSDAGAQPTPTPRPRVVASGTALPIVLKEALSTKTAQPEQRVAAELAEDVVVDGDVLLPAGSEVRGHVVSSLRSGRVKGKAQLVVAFDQVRAGGKTYRIDATGLDVTAGKSTGKDAKIVGGAAAGGVLIGAIAGGGSGAAKGGLIGGAAGGAAVLATRGKEVELPAGSRYTIELRKSLRLD